METRKQANYALKIESVKNRIVCSNLKTSNASITPKILKNYDNLGNLFINMLQKNLDLIMHL